MQEDLLKEILTELKNLKSEVFSLQMLSKVSFAQIQIFLSLENVAQFM
jgi:hypothetical protein